MANEKIKLLGQRLVLRNVEEQDFPVLYQYVYGETDPEWKEWNAPYFPLVRQTFAEYGDSMRRKIATEELPAVLAIEHDGRVIGTVSYYWEHKESWWLEMGIVIYDSAYWSHGYGLEALRMWGDFLFASLPLVRIGLTTWSGNARMVRCAEKLGMQMEARLRKCRLHKGVYYDSIRMGILREEWEAQQALR